MNIKKFTGAALALLMLYGTSAAVSAPAVYAESGAERELYSEFTDRYGFIMASDINGDQFVCGYSGPGGAVTLPADAVYVSKNAFAGNKSITSLTVPETCWNGIEERAFAGCINLETVVFEGDVEFIGEQAFYGCIGLQTVTFKGDVCESYYYGRYDGGGIFDSAFFGCKSLRSVKFTDSGSKLSCIGTNAFSNCLSLSSVKLPEHTPTIYGAFINCPELLSVDIPFKTMIDKGSFGYLKDYAGYDDDPLVKADGKTTVSALYFTYDAVSNTLQKNYVYITPQPVVLSVVKGSDADKIADKYGIEHVSKLPAPNNVAAMGNKSGLILIWNNVYGADAYRVYIYDYSIGKYKKYKDVSSAQCRVTDIEEDTTYKFIVAPLKKVNGKYIAGELSKPVKFRDSHT